MRPKGTYSANCIVPGCSKPNGTRRKEMCFMHYYRVRMHGDPNTIITPPPASVRFFTKVEKTDDCWLWVGGIGSRGYGVFWDANRSWAAHRVSYVMANGPIPDGLQLDHLCRNRACVNPSHLEPVTCRENLLRGVSFSAVNAAKTNCKRGHEFSPSNTRTRPDGSRACRECERIYQRKEYKAGVA